MINKRISILLCVVLQFYSCTENKLEEVDYTTNQCKGYASFTKQFGFAPDRSAFTTNLTKKKGLFFIEMDANGNTVKLHQDSTWKQAGDLAALLTDETGNTWCLPAPVINTLYNPLRDQNNLYRVSGATGKMELFMKLPGIDTTNIENPYGLMGLAYNCDAHILYVSSIAGSTRSTQRGKIFAIDPINKEIIDTYSAGDVFGLGITKRDGYHKLYMGSARNSNIYTIGLTKEGKFVGTPQLAGSIQGLGPRGDDKVKKIREVGKGDLEITGFEFNFNLTAPAEKQEQKYTLKYNMGTEKWEVL
jgi:hypothetical protein